MDSSVWLQAMNFIQNLILSYVCTHDTCKVVESK
jgi:hypothetical protein